MKERAAAPELECDRRPAGRRDMGGGREARDTGGTTRRTPKWTRVLRGFLDRGARGLNRFEAERELRDHVLPTTVSQLEDRGVRILRREETVAGHFGDIHCCRYWLAPEALERARELLGERQPAGTA